MNVLYKTLEVVNPVSVQNGDIRDLALRAVTGGLFGFSTQSDVLFTPFRWAEPVSNADRIAGGICGVTGYWAPGHCMVMTERGKCIDVFAPNYHTDGLKRS